MGDMRMRRRSVLAATMGAFAAGAGGSRQGAAQAEGPAASWTQLADGPSARWDHALAADDTAGRLILFGGRDNDGAPLGDGWVYDAAADAWEPLAGGPSPRFGHAVVVDGAARALYLFGGQADGATFFDDAWVLDLDDLTWEPIAAGAPGPSARYGTSAVLDDAGRVVVSHGFTFEGRFDDTWALDPAAGAWADLSPAPETRPLKRCLHEAIWDDASGRMLLFGGCSSGFGPCPQGDLWSFDPATGAWADATPTTGPAPRSNPALVANGGRAVLFGGLTAEGYVADAWTFALGNPDTITWSETTTTDGGPGPRASHDAATLNGRLYLFGGYGPAGATADLWATAVE